MTKYREILRLKSLGISEREIATSCSVSRNTVARVCKRAAELNIQWSLDPSVTDKDLKEQLFPREEAVVSGKRLTYCDYICKELLKNGVTKKLLWTEYLEECRQAGEEPFMYSQFCYHIQQAEEKRRATMHIARKPGEQIEVDWAEDPIYIALSYAMGVKYDPNAPISLKADEILKSYKKIPKDLTRQLKLMMFLYRMNIHLFDICCKIMGKRIST